MIHTDTLTRRLYAADASMYEELPDAVAFPQNAEDIRALVRAAYLKGTSITARGAGTSLAGQATGGGVVMDVSRYMNKILQAEPQRKRVRVEPGVIRDSLNRELQEHGLFFGPDTSTTNRCMIGGMIGNNSAGSFSIKYGTTRDHTQEIEAVLSDGSMVTFGPLSRIELDEKLRLDTLEGYIYRGMIRIIQKNRQKILDNFPHPEIIRRNTGYALDRLCMMQPFVADGPPFNLAVLLCGSEGTLAMTTAATLTLADIPTNKLLLIPQFRSLNEAMEATVRAVKYEPAAVELVDDIILNATKGNREQARNRFFLEEDPSCILIIQFEGNSEEELREQARSLEEDLKKSKLGYSYPLVEEPELMERVWDLRKAGLGLLMGLGKDSRSPTFCEDTAVRVKDLPEYVKDFRELLARHESSCVFYAHASVGELHLRPVIDITTDMGLQKMKVMAEEIAELVRSYRGSLSGEHGDGRARAPYIEKVLGPEMMPLIRQVKELWDPHYLFNPGKIVKPEAIDKDLRFSPDYVPSESITVFKWRKEGSFADALELCNGAGVCRKRSESGGTMCPSYMATLDEKDSTRGRANIFRQVFTGTEPEAFSSEDLNEALDLCLSCKACKSECPANVDMARMKAEFQHGRQEQEGKSVRTRFFSETAMLYRLASRFPALSNTFLRSPAVKALLEEFVGISSKRQLPEFAKQTFEEWWKSRIPENPGAEPVVLFVDLFTNYHEPQIGKAAVRILEKGGYNVRIGEGMQSGRIQISRGVLKEAQQIAHDMINEYAVYASRGIPVIGIEPSEILTFRDEYLDLCEDEYLDRAGMLAHSSYTLEEFLENALNRFNPRNSGNKGPVILHGHCHMKALKGNEPAIKVLNHFGYQVQELDAGCCGMAGSFGYEKEHYDLSMKIGSQRLFPAVKEKSDADICASGFSCRHQISDGIQRKGSHIAELILRAL
ncbi:FAD-binding and (Fe-S)-binding domain-containing protein [Balneola sp. MJW-20]|uniref:FAD-binding and (Fe-S)-binding domain-containing protein n=1 Tax=Gracilimonas aurantiaca TaxID=3234185 RepID=UPI003464F345